uniref:Uncharacterized protein n=1 Tax=Arundo donax TaxID=35708 RepID=A0A0A9G0T9_ARUDO
MEVCQLSLMRSPI